ncbi:MAG: gamma-glutamylcyclotransferase, partial [Ktedonobacterales bacterium]
DIYPYVFDTSDGSRVYGELMFPLPHLYEDVLAHLDELEDYREGDPSSMYLRVKRPVQYAGADGEPQTITAWVYHAGPDYKREATEQNRIPGGDWLSTGEEQ